MLQGPLKFVSNQMNLCPNSFNRLLLILLLYCDRQQWILVGTGGFSCLQKFFGPILDLPWNYFIVSNFCLLSFGSPISWLFVIFEKFRLSFDRFCWIFLFLLAKIWESQQFMTGGGRNQNFWLKHFPLKAYIWNGEALFSGTFEN